jgi:hypothetical protein
LWGLIAGLTRSNGWALAPMLVAMALADRTARHRLRAAVLATGPVAGTVVFSVYIWSLTGQPLAWLHAQAGWGRSFEPAAFVTRRASQLLEQGLWNYLAADPVDAIAVACVVGSLAGALAAGRRFGWRFALFPLAYLLPALLIDLPAIGRMTSVLFVSFVGLASALGNRQTLVVAGMSALLQCWLAARFFTWQTPH